MRKNLIKMRKAYRTRGGRPARVICVDRIGDFPVIALVKTVEGNESPIFYTKDGYYLEQKSQHTSDLIEISHEESFDVEIENPFLAGLSDNSIWKKQYSGVVEYN